MKMFFTGGTRRIHWFWSGRYWYAGLVSSKWGHRYRVCGVGETRDEAYADMVDLDREDQT